MAAPVPFEFDDEWSGASQWAGMYRSLEWQVVPAHVPSDGGQWKRPMVDWLEFRDRLTPDTLFARWFDPKTGEFATRKNMGIITGLASTRVFCVDLDVKPGSQAESRWRALLTAHFNDMEPDTPKQRTGGGGRQIFFRAPVGWEPPTFKTPIGIDIRGQGGFAMLPPSLHASGQTYDWEPGYAPWETEVRTASEELIEWIADLREEFGGVPKAGPSARTATPEERNLFGLTVDGREQKMAEMVWAAIVDLCRESPIRPSQTAQEAEIARLWSNYELTTKTRLEARDGLTNGDLLEMENRGPSDLRRKWSYVMQRWETKVLAASREPRPNPAPAVRQADDPDDEFPSQGEARASDIGTPEVPPLTPVTPFHGQAPPRRWLVLEWIAEGVVNSFYAPPGLGKSLLALQLGAAVSLGQRWLGVPTEQGRVLMMSCEDGAEELHRRTDEIKRALGYAVGWPFPDFHIFDRVGQENRLAVPSKHGDIQPGPFLAPLEAALNAYRPALLILDTLADVYTANEIDRGQVNYFLKTILGGLIARQKQQGHTLTILLLGHPSDAGKAAGGKGYSGSGAWEAGVRSRLYLSQPDGAAADERILTRGKANYASAGDETAIRIMWSEGVFLADRDAAHGDPDLARTRARALLLIRIAWEARAPYTQQRGHRFFVFKALLKVLTDEGVERSLARQAIRELIEDGRVESQKRGGQSGLKPND